MPEQKTITVVIDRKDGSEPEEVELVVDKDTADKLIEASDGKASFAYVTYTADPDDG